MAVDAVQFGVDAAAHALRLDQIDARDCAANDGAITKHLAILIGYGFEVSFVDGPHGNTRRIGLKISAS